MWFPASPPIYTGFSVPHPPLFKEGPHAHHGTTLSSSHLGLAFSSRAPSHSRPSLISYTPSHCTRVSLREVPSPPHVHALAMATPPHATSAAAPVSQGTISTTDGGRPRSPVVVVLGRAVSAPPARPEKRRRSRGPQSRHAPTRQQGCRHRLPTSTPPPTPTSRRRVTPAPAAQPPPAAHRATSTPPLPPRVDASRPPPPPRRSRRRRPARHCPQRPRRCRARARGPRA